MLLLIPRVVARAELGADILQARGFWTIGIIDPRTAAELSVIRARSDEDERKKEDALLH